MRAILLIDGSDLIASVSVVDLDTGWVSEPFFSASGSDNLAQIADEVLMVLNLQLHDLRGIGLNAGPGSYTGLRISTAFAKGICTGLKLPLYPLSGLRALSNDFMKKYEDFQGAVITMLDARRNEVFASAYQQKKTIIAEGPYVVDESFVSMFREYAQIAMIGSGASKGVHFFQAEKLIFEPSMRITAASLATELISSVDSLSASELRDFEPNYLKPFYFPDTGKC
jgi:tRNA threonylcarbamoyladenosine biosynthesis protein TsaB